MIENGAEFADSFIENLLRIIKHMAPKKEKKPELPKDTLASKFPGLALPNELPVIKMEKESDEKKNDIDDAMAALEALAPSQIKEVERARSRSPKKKSRSDDKKRRRSRSNERKRSRSRSLDRDQKR